MQHVGISIFLFCSDVTLWSLIGYPLASSILCYYIYLLVMQKQPHTLIAPGIMYALESLLLQDNYGIYLIVMIPITYIILLLSHCLNKTLLLALLLIVGCGSFQGIISSIAWQLPALDSLFYTSTVISGNIMVMILLWYIFDKGKQGNR